mmetsp:Transcript_66671/g.145369  ORF Transcript_66671/g.145369 Transcript_66671/m.145369 type:complete len:208 (+) Transcript_66671:953-1576(+)
MTKGFSMYFCAIQRDSAPLPTPTSRIFSRRADSWMPRPRLLPAGFSTQMFCKPSRPNCGSLFRSASTTAVASAKTEASSALSNDAAASEDAAPVAVEAVARSVAEASGLSLASRGFGFSLLPGCFSDQALTVCHSLSLTAGCKASSRASSTSTHRRLQTARAASMATRGQPEDSLPPSSTKRRSIQRQVVSLKSSTKFLTCTGVVKS